MTRARTAPLALGPVALLAGLLAACATSRAGRESGLEQLLGTWDGSATTELLATGERLEVHTTTVAEWARPGEVLLERTVGEVAGQRFTTLTVWVWDPEARACRTWRLGADGSWLDTEVTDAGFDEGAGASFVEGEALLRRPELALGVSVGWRAAEALRLDVSARRTGARWDRDFTAWPAAPVELAAYTRVDAAVEWTVFAPRDSRPGMDLLLRLENLADERYQEVFGFPAPGRAVLVGGRLSLAR
mgnify:CR=1 FL=1